LILVAGIALLNAGGQDLFGGHVSDRDPGVSDLAAENHRSMAHHPDQDRRGLWFVQMETGSGFSLSLGCEAGEGHQHSTTEKQ
jgi:hypothetical protein